MTDPDHVPHLCPACRTHVAACGRYCHACMTILVALDDILHDLPEPEAS